MSYLPRYLLVVFIASLACKSSSSSKELPPQPKVQPVAAQAPAPPQEPVVGEEAALPEAEALKRYESLKANQAFEGARSDQNISDYIEEVISDPLSLMLVTQAATGCPLGWGPNCVHVKYCSYSECEMGPRFEADIYVGDAERESLLLLSSLGFAESDSSGVLVFTHAEAVKAIAAITDEISEQKEDEDMVRAEQEAMADLDVDAPVSETNKEVALDKEVALKRFQAASPNVIFEGSSTDSTLIVYMKDVVGIDPDLAKVKVEAGECPLAWGPNCVHVSVCANEQCEGASFLVDVYIGDEDGGVQLVLAELDLDGKNQVIVTSAFDINKEHTAALERYATQAGKERDKSGKCCCEFLGDVFHQELLTPEQCSAPDMDGSCVELNGCS